MLDPYKMVVVNVATLLLLLSGILFYKYIYPKKNIHPLVLVILFSVLPIISIARKGAYESGDLNIHVKLAMDFYDSLSDGNLIPHWNGGRSCLGYGCPDFIFLYTLPYYIISFFHFIGFSFIASTKLLLATAFIGSGITMYLWAKEEFGKVGGIVSAIFYLYSPYHLIDTHFRATIAETTSFVFIPLCFLFVKKFLKNNQKKWLILEAISIMLLILSHQAISLAIFPFLIAYTIFTWKKGRNENKTKLVFCFISLTLGLLLSSFYWVPILYEAKYIYWGNFAEISFVPINYLIYSPWRFGFLFQGHQGELAPVIGYTQLAVLIYAIFLFIKNKIKKKENSILLFFLISFFIIFFMLNEISKPIWQIIPFLKNFQFSMRLLVLISFFTSAIAGIFVNNINKKLIILLICFLVIATTILNWGHRKTIPEINDTNLKNESLITASNSLTSITAPLWTYQTNWSWISSKRKRNIETITGDADIKELSRNSIKHTYIINAKTDVYIKENTFYYPGWKLIINNQPKSINFQNSKYPGIITFKLNKGLYKAELIFSNTPIRIISKQISLLSFISIVLYSIFLFSKKLKFK